MRTGPDFKALEEAVSYSESFDPSSVARVDRSELNRHLRVLAIHDLLKFNIPYMLDIDDRYPGRKLEEAFRRIVDRYERACVESVGGANIHRNFLDHMVDEVLVDSTIDKDGLNVQIAYFVMKYRDDRRIENETRT